MLFIHNIRSVAKYESKLLLRSWFFKVFTILAVLILTFFNFAMLVDKGQAVFMWVLRAVPANIPYVNLLLLNTGQAVIAIFLASEFLKRDKKLDTSEVFYVRPLSNAEYVIGKIWGNLKVFLVMNIIVLIVALVFNLVAKQTTVDWGAYVSYFFLISIPTLIFILGFSIFLMLVLKNQALTFVILLGYIGLTVFYISDKFYYVFDYMAYSLPLFKSTITGFVNMETIFTHRAIYLFLGLAFIFFTIFLFKRLPNSSRSHYPWVAVSLALFLMGVGFAYKHVGGSLEQNRLRDQYIALNNRYVHTPKITVDRYDITVEQQPSAFSATVHMTGAALETSGKFTFCLNPGLKVTRVQSEGKDLAFMQDKQILVADFGQPVAKGDSVRLSVEYGGTIDESICYLDIPEEVRIKKNSNFLINLGKRASFLTDDYLLVTPETYWYPRPGTAFSDESPDWQQTYFSRFDLKVKPLPGLFPLSQGESEEKDGVYTFRNDALFQAISLIIGDYKQKTTVADSVRYNIWYIDGHDYFSAPYDTLTDTIPFLIKNMRGNLERQYKLSYPFKRFSIVETPASFFSYPRAWSQAQETVQPEMVLFPEKSMTFDDGNIVEMQKKYVEWSKYWGDNQEIGMEEGLMRATNSFFWIFLRSQGYYSFNEGSRGQGNISADGNPYFLFPELYNFRYNIYSDEWPIANRLIELYLQNNTGNNSWIREINGISNDEKANLLMEKQPFKDLLANVKYRDLIDNFIALKINYLLAPAEIYVGKNAFRDSMYALLERNTFGNIRFEPLLDTLGAIGNADLRSHLPEWERPTPLPMYRVGQPEVIHAVNRDGEKYQLSILIHNDSDHDGIVDINIYMWSAGQLDKETDAKTRRKLAVPARQTKKMVVHLDYQPNYFSLNTLVSGNLPSIIEVRLQNVRNERNYPLEPEGESIVPNASFTVPGEIIVDNEDSLLFAVSEPEVGGLLPKWLDRMADDSFKYSGVSWWRAPIQWTPTTNAGYYGEFVRSAYVIKSGNGKQTATWKVPLPEHGTYEVYYYVYKDSEVRWQRREGEYHFRIDAGKETEDAYLNLRRSEDGWERLGVYYFETDTARVVLNNECKLRTVAADAVKFVKRNY